MTTPPMPERGHMVLFDRMKVPLPDGEYTLHVATDVASPGAPLPSADRHFNVEGPRFALAPTDVAGVFPPQNGKGEFSDALPHIALKRRTLPWERTSDPTGNPPAADGPTPWLALLLLDETGTPEATILRAQKVTDVLPSDVVTALAPPADATCDALEVPHDVLMELLPIRNELRLLTHVRQVNTDDRELSAEDSEGWFSVVMSNRLPREDHKYRACLVSLEGRSDLVATALPPVAPPPGRIHAGGLHTTVAEPLGGAGTAATTSSAVGSTAAAGSVVWTGAVVTTEGRFLPGVHDIVLTDRLVLLYSWTFECKGAGTFRHLAQHIDVGMIGEVRDAFPKVTDTGHVALAQRDRAGTEHAVWYRGPLVPLPVSRDTRGPYHSADQARRVSPETGMEDVSYAAAFEVGRLLAAADGRLAQELMRWRRTDYRASVIATRYDAIRVRFPSFVDGFPMETVAAQLTGRWADARVPVVDPYETALAANAPGLSPARLGEAWSISEDAARQLLSARVAALAPPVAAAPSASPIGTTLDAVAHDTAGLGRLQQSRAAAVDLLGRTR